MVPRDLHSRNGSYLNGERTTDSVLRGRDRIKIGGSIFLFSVEHDPMATIGDTRGVDRSVAGAFGARRDPRPCVSRSTDQQIAERLIISLSTVRSHLDRIRDKTGLRRRAELTRLAIELGLDG